MRAIRRSLLYMVAMVAVVVLSSCGSSSGTGSTTYGGNTPAASTPTSASTGSTTGKYGSGDTPTATASSGGAVTVKSVSAPVNGKAETILTDAKGMTLYYLTSDTKAMLACTGGCAQAWPPLLFSGSGSVQSAAKLPGELAVYKNANGNQVSYNDHPLYTFSGDSAAGQTHGEGIQGAGGTWHVAASDLGANT